MDTLAGLPSLESFLDLPWWRSEEILAVAAIVLVFAAGLFAFSLWRRR